LRYLDNFAKFRRGVTHFPVAGARIPAGPDLWRAGVLLLGGLRTGVLVLGGPRTGVLLLGGPCTGVLLLGGLRTGVLLLGGLRTGVRLLGGLRTGVLLLGNVRPGVVLLPDLRADGLLLPAPSLAREESIAGFLRVPPSPPCACNSVTGASFMFGKNVWSGYPIDQDKKARKVLRNICSQIWH
jgi:hypothetical protein